MTFYNNPHNITRNPNFISLSPDGMPRDTSISGRESGYSTPDSTRPKKVIYEVIVWCHFTCIYQWSTYCTVLYWLMLFVEWTICTQMKTKEKFKSLLSKTLLTVDMCYCLLGLHCCCAFCIHLFFFLLHHLFTFLNSIMWYLKQPIKIIFLIKL